MAAHAQDADETTADEVAQDGVILVTAQRREQDLQDVPAAVTALSGDMLQSRQIADTNDLQNQIPGVVISTGTGTSNSARIYFRGIGEDESRGAIDPAVGIYVDNVYLGRTVGSLVDLVDIEQIEVLRGPQGTLYGRNTNGGAIKITSVRPQTNEISLAGELGYGNFDRLQGRITGNLGFEDGAVRISAMHRRRDGYFTFNPNGAFAAQAGTEIGREEVFAIRASFLAELSDTWDVLVIADHSTDNSQPMPSSFIAQSNDPAVRTDRDGDIFTVEPLDNVTCSSLTPANFLAVGCFGDFRSNVKTQGVSLQATGNYDNFSVTSTTAYRTLNDELSTHISFPYSQQTDQNQFSQELLFSSDFDGMINFVAGAYYYNESAALAFNFVFPFDLEFDTESFALFSQATVELGALNLTGGLRWTTETREFLGNAGGPLAGFGTGIARDFETDNITWTAKADYSLTDDVLVYASYSTGFKTPGTSADCFSPAACFRGVNEEELDAIEVGVRTQFAEGRGTFNATYFYNDYRDLQISGTLPTGGFTRINAGEATIQGIELEGSIRPTSGLTIYGNASWLDAQYEVVDFAQAGLLSGSTTTAAGPTCSAADPTDTAYQQQIIDCALKLDLKNAPEWKALLGFNYDIFTDAGDIFFGADFAYEEDSFGLVANNPGSLSEPGFRIDARVGFETSDERWRITLWGKNLTDREYFRAATGLNQVYASPPLTFGVDVGFRFD